MQEVEIVSCGSQTVITRTDLRRPLLRRKRPSNVGFCRPARFAADLFLNSEGKQAPLRLVDFDRP
jgi:hypothetical protein